MGSLTGPVMSYWVCRVLAGVTLAARVSAAGRPLSKLLEDGVLALGTDMEVLEAIASCAEEQPCHEWRDKLAAQYPGEDLRVIMMVSGGG